MTSFLEETLDQIGKEQDPWASLILVLPSKRACGFVRHYLKNQTTQAGFAPKIISIEQLISAVSGLQLITGEALLVEAYKAYLAVPSSSSKDNFQTFCEWSSTVLADFNEMDRYLVPSRSFFEYLKEIKTLERWGQESEGDDLTRKYLDFWGTLEAYYHALNDHLIKLNCGYQGMLYRMAAEDIEHYSHAQQGKKHVFIGFNALNAAEQHMVQALLENGSASIYWDMDGYFHDRPQHGAARFMKRYFRDWKYYQLKSKPLPQRHYELQKHITVSNAANEQLLVKHVGDLLANMDQEQLAKTAIVLADERLLQPLLLSLPENLDRVNITMGAPMDTMPLSRWVQELFLFHSHKTNNWYYKDLFRLIDTAIFRKTFPQIRGLIEGMNTDNRASIALEGFNDYLEPETVNGLKNVLVNHDRSSARALESAAYFLGQAKERGKLSTIEKLVCEQLQLLVQQLQHNITEHPFLAELPALLALWEVMIKQQQLDFEGDAYDGLQIMGVLETRVLDFEHLIMLSVNEGILPAGRSNASYITADMKLHFSLPTYQDKDAIYTYHFFRLLQRTKQVQLCYNGSSQGLTTGEPSRYITQLLYEDLPQHHIVEQSLSTPVLSTPPAPPAQIDKSPEVIARLEEICANGWSPSALTAYLYDPLQFYFDRVIGIRETEQLEEEVAANTMGNAVHKALENLYADFVGNDLTISGLDALLPKIDAEMQKQFEAYFRAGSFDSGKNLLVFEVAKRFVEQQIALDRSQLEQGKNIRLLALEEELSMDLNLAGIAIPVKLKGTIDRIDRLDGQLRIIDYKTGKVEPADLKIHDWGMLMDSDKHLKAIQVLAYALMVHDQGLALPYTAGIISFKNIKEGLMNFGKRDKPRSKNVNYTIDDEVLDQFVIQLEGLLLQILDPAIPFKEKTPED